MQNLGLRLVFNGSVLSLEVSGVYDVEFVSVSPTQRSSTFHLSAEIATSNKHKLVLCYPTVIRQDSLYNARQIFQLAQTKRIYAQKFTRTQ